MLKRTKSCNERPLSLVHSNHTRRLTEKKKNTCFIDESVIFSDSHLDFNKILTQLINEWLCKTSSRIPNRLLNKKKAEKYLVRLRDEWQVRNEPTYLKSNFSCFPHKTISAFLRKIKKWIFNFFTFISSFSCPKRETLTIFAFKTELMLWHSKNLLT